MDPMLDAFDEVVASIELRDPEIELISNRTGMAAEAGLLTSPGYWRDHVREAVRFEESVRHAVEIGHRAFLEVGPAPTLVAMARACDLPADAVTVAASRRSDDEARELHRAVAALHVSGLRLDWKAYEASWPRRRTSLPTYPFERQRFWHPRVDADHRGSASAPAHDDDASLLGRRIRSPRLDGVVFERELLPHSPPWLADHVVYGATIVPATAYLEMMRRAGGAAGVGCDVVDVRIDEPLRLDDEHATVVQTIVDGDGEAVEVSSLSAADDRWRCHARGRLLAAPEPPPPAPGARDELDLARSRCREPIDGADYYEVLRGVGVDYGPTFRRLERAVRRDGEVVATLRAPERDGDATAAIHPALADACLQALGLAMPGAGDLSADHGDAYLPVAVERWHVAGDGAGELTAHGRLRPGGDGSGPGGVAIGDLELFDEDGALVASITGVRFKRAARTALAVRSGAEQDWFYAPRWEPVPLPAEQDVASLSGHWVVLGGGRLGGSLAELIRRDGATAALVEVRAGTTMADVGAELDAQLAASPSGVVLACPLSEEGSPSFEAACLADLVARLAHLETSVPLTVVTPGAMAVVPGDRAEGHEHAPVWGVGRVVASALPQQRCRLVDVDGLAGAECVHAELLADDRAEPQLAWRGGVRYALRLARAADVEALRLPDGPYELEIAERGRLDALRLVGQPQLEAGPGEVLIDVRATGLNFRDVLNALGRYEGDASSLGGECAGVVVAIGDGVERIRPGDRVMAVAEASFASRCVVPEQMACPQPRGWSDAESASVPITFLTADYALNHLGRMQAGDRVLIHAAAGGVGLAAVQLAQRAGAEIFATAGSDAKRDALRARWASATSTTLVAWTSGRRSGATPAAPGSTSSSTRCPASRSRAASTCCRPRDGSWRSGWPGSGRPSRSTPFDRTRSTTSCTSGRSASISRS